MSTRCSIGYADDGENSFHVYEDWNEPGCVFVRLPREALAEMDGGTVTLALKPDLWDRIRACAPLRLPDEPPSVEGLVEFLDSIKPKTGERV